MPFPSILRLKQRLVRTPLERPAKALQRVLKLRKLIRHPELREIHLEDGRLERAIARLLQRDSSCIDVGCHIGSMLSLFLRLAPDGQHRAFEPVPERAAWLRSKFSDVEIHEVAVSDTAGSMPFFENRSRPGFSGLSLDQAAGDSIERYEVRTERLDRLVPEDAPVHLLKIDAEGAERQVLLGARELLLRARPVVVFECGPDGAARFGYESTDLWDFFTQLGYEIRTPRGSLEGAKALTRTEFSETHVYPFTAFNFLATRPEGASVD